jgi:major membrane immunogen (membrane-anchored lipoprotein)
MKWVDDGIGTQTCGVYMATTTLPTGDYKYWIEAYEDHEENNYVRIPIRGAMSWS